MSACTIGMSARTHMDFDSALKHSMLVLAPSCNRLTDLLHLQLRAKAMALEKQLNDSKKDSQQMVAALQQNMTEKVTDLRDKLTSAQVQCQRMMMWGVRVMGSRHTSILLRETWAVWKELTWQGGDLQTRERKLQQLLERFGRSKSHRVFRTWWDLVNLAKHARQKAEKACGRLVHQQLVACFGVWQDAAAAGAHKRAALLHKGLQTRHLRAAVRQWVASVHESRSREQVCTWMASRARQRQVACMFRLWRQLPLDAQASADDMNIRLQQRLLAACFAAWCSAASEAHGTDGVDSGVFAVRTCRRICKATFREWWRNAARNARNREVVVRRYAALAWRIQSRVLVEWRSTTLRRRRGRRIAARCSEQRRQRCMHTVLDAWRGVKEGGRTPVGHHLEHSLFRRCAALPHQTRSLNHHGFCTTSCYVLSVDS